MAKHVLGLEPVDDDLLNEVYQITTENPFPYSQSNFLNAICIRAFDIVVLAKAPANPVWRRSVNDLIERLWAKAGMIGWLIWFSVIGVLFLLAVWLVFSVKGLANVEVRKWIETLDVLGIPLIAVIPCIPWFTKRKKIIGRIQRLALSSAVRSRSEHSAPFIAVNSVPFSVMLIT